MAEPTRKITIDPEEIRTWVEENGGEPARIKAGVGALDPGEIRIKFFDVEEKTLETISWDDFFRQFEREELAMLYLQGAGQEEPFYRLISRRVDFDETI